MLVFALPLGAVAENHIEYGLNREPFQQPLAFTNDSINENVSQELNPDIVGQWLLAESGSGSYVAEECGAGPDGTANEFQLAWGSDPLFTPPDNLDAGPDDSVVQPIEDMNVSINLGPIEGLPEPIGTGEITFLLEVGWVRPGTGALHGPHTAWEGEASVSPSLGLDDLPELPLDGLPGILPGQVGIPVNFGADDSQIEANSMLVFFLTVTCAGDALFELQFGSIGNLLWTWGDPSWDDSDNDGVPDDLDTHPDGTEWSRADQVFYGTNPLDPSDVPSNEAEHCPGFTIQEAKDENPDFDRDDPDTCPGTGGLNWLLLILALLLVVLLAGGAFGAVTTVNKKIRMTVSHDGFQDIKRGESAQYELQLTAKGKEDEEVPVELSLKGVPEDWSASVEPAHLTLIAGEEQEPVLANLTVTPPSEEEYEAEALVTVTATPTDEDGKTSPVKPGTSVKTKTIVNIDVEPPEGEKRKKVKKPKGMEQEAGTAQAEEGADEDEGGSRKGKKMGGLGLLRRKKGKDEAEEDEEGDQAEGGEGADAQEGAPGAAGAAAASEGKPDLAVGKLAHDPADFSAGDEVTTTVPVKNKGDGPVEGLMLRLYVNDDRVAEEELDLQPGESSEVTFTWTAQPDENRVRVRGGLKEA